MKSNVINVLEDVYNMYISHYDAYRILNEINEKYPNCSDVSLIDIKSMISDINFALDFTEGSNYIIENKDRIECIIPFDSKQKGITEKEFNGFIH